MLKQKLVALKAQPDGQPESSGTGKAAEGLALKRKAAQPEGLESSAGKAATGAAPSRHSVPEHVLSALSKLTLLPPSKPFSTAPEGQKGAKPAAKKQAAKQKNLPSRSTLQQPRKRLKTNSTSSWTLRRLARLSTSPGISRSSRRPS